MATSLVSTGVQFPDATIQTTAATGAIGGTTASGSVTLTSASAGAQSITPTANGQYVKLPSATTMSKGGLLFAIQNNSAYDLKIIDSANTTKGFIKGYQTATVGLADNSTAAGVWVLGNTVLYARSATAVLAPVTATTIRGILTIDADRDLYLLSGTGGTYGIVYSKLDGFGSLTTVRAGTSTTIGAVKTTTDQFFLYTWSTTAYQASILTFSGTTITQGTVATATISSPTGYYPNTGNTTALISSTSVIVMSSDQYIGNTISGTTVTIGSPVAYAVAATTSIGVFSTGTSTAIAVTYDSAISKISLYGLTLSGSTVVTSAVEEFTLSSIAVTYFGYAMNGSRFVWFRYNGTSELGCVTSVSGAATSTTSDTIRTGLINSDANYFVLQNKFLIFNYVSSAQFELLSFNCGTATATANTTVTITTTSASAPGTRMWPSGTSQVSMIVQYTSNSSVYTSDVSSAPTTPVFSYGLQVKSTPINNTPVTTYFGTTNRITAVKNSTNIIFNPLNTTTSTDVVIWGSGNAIISPAIPGFGSESATILTQANESGTCYGQLATYSGTTTIRSQLSVLELAQ